MMRCLTIFLFVALWVASANAFWQSKDAKPIDELSLMNEGELASEASKVCIDLTIGGKLIRSDDRLRAWRYLETIGRVIRQRNAGRVPQWVDHLILAAYGKNKDACTKASSEAGDACNHAHPDLEGRIANCCSVTGAEACRTFGELEQNYTETVTGKPVAPVPTPASR
jgi:hypothetical protein